MAKSADRYCLQKIFMAGKIHLSQYIFKLLSTESTLGITSFTASKYVLKYLVIKYGKKQCTISLLIIKLLNFRSVHAII